MRPVPYLLAAALVLALTAACAGSPGPSARPGGSSSTSSGAAGSSTDPSAGAPSTSPAAPSSSAAPSTGPDALPAVRHPVSLPALMRQEDDGRGLRLRAVLARTSAYVRHAVTYRSDGLRISGVMNVPRGKGPFPVLVLAHGYIDPAVYVTGQGLRREQDYLAREGYAVLHTDYRDHAGSDDDPGAEERLRLGYTRDVLNAVAAVRRSSVRGLDRERVGLLGRSMGGGVVLNALVVRPGLVDAAVVYAPVSSRTFDNVDRWIRGEPGREGLAARIDRRYGTPSERPAFWRGVSPRSWFDRVTEPVLVHHGTADESVPIRWSERTVSALRDAGAPVRYRVYRGEPHAFVADWPLSMRRTVAFLERHGLG